MGDATKEAHDPMAALESSAGGGGGNAPMFVKSNVGSKPVQSTSAGDGEDEDEDEEQAVRNPDAIEMDMSDEDDE